MRKAVTCMFFSTRRIVELLQGEALEQGAPGEDRGAFEGWDELLLFTGPVVLLQAYHI